MPPAQAVLEVAPGGFPPFPPAFDVGLYRRLWPDLRDLSDEALQEHYGTHGLREGRQANALASRADFVALLPPDLAALEIGPFCKPVLRGPSVKYFDVLERSALQDRAAMLGVVNPNAPHIDYVSPVGDLSVVPNGFGAVLSSHCLEHQPDLIAHLRQVARILRVGGRYFLLVPDKRYCFDALIAESTVADVVQAHVHGHSVHALKSVIEHRALTTHNDAAQHWLGNHGSVQAELPKRLLAALGEFHAADGGYVDVHAWQFTPMSALFC